MPIPFDKFEAHKHSSLHREEILTSERCGCFYCLAEFVPTDILDWVDAPLDAADAKVNELGQTALCPRCGIDSVLGDASGYQINQKLLREMHAHWFSQTVNT